VKLTWNTRTAAIIAALTFSNLIGAGSGLAEGQSTVTYRIEVQNVTGGNVLSPFLTVVHSSRLQIAALGQKASDGIAALAETGNRNVLTDELQKSKLALNITGAEGGPILPGESRAVEITVPSYAVKAGARLDLFSMIGRSNDSFVTLGGIPLTSITGVVGSSVRLKASNYDAGSEENTGNLEDFGPGGHPVEFAEGKVSLDRGLNSRGNAPEHFSWGPTAAIVTIKRVH
jgi:hypothetical protein